MSPMDELKIANMSKRRYKDKNVFSNLKTKGYHRRRRKTPCEIPEEYMDNFYGISESLKSFLAPMVSDLYHNHQYWMVRSSFDYIKNTSSFIFPYVSTIDNQQEYYKLLDSYYLTDIRFTDRKKRVGGYRVDFFFCTKMKAEDGYRYELHVAVNCHMSLNKEFSYTIASVGINRK